MTSILKCWSRLQGTVSDSNQSYHQEYKLCKHPTLVQKWAYGKKYYQQDDRKDFHQSRVIAAVHESLHSCASTVTSLFQRGVDARKICAITCTKHKDERSLFHYISETTIAQERECSKILIKWHVSATTRCSTRSFRNHKAKCRRPVSRSYLKLKPTVSSPKPIYFLGKAVPKLHPTYSDWSNEHLSRKVWRTVAINLQSPPNNRERW